MGNIAARIIASLTAIVRLVADPTHATRFATLGFFDPRSRGAYSTTPVNGCLREVAEIGIFPGRRNPRAALLERKA